MVHLLVDTCIWLDIPKDPSQRETLNYLEELCKLGEVSLIVPRKVLDEFTRNKARVSHECGQSLSTVLKRVKDAIRKFGPPGKRERDKTLQNLNDLDHKLPFLSEAASETLNQIEDLLNRFPVVETTDPIMLRAAKRAASNVAPCHTGRNSINDAIILETYVESVANARNGQRFMFATHNKKDFSHKDDQRNPHPDIAPLFSKIKSRFFISLVDAIRRIRPDVRAELLEQEYNWLDEVRTLTEIVDAMDVLCDKVWYGRHGSFAYLVQSGKIKVVPDKEYDPKLHSSTVKASIWKGALASARRTEKEIGTSELGPWSDFEWGMINGKLSALRWVLGSEWDMLDT